jgi:intracellular sulfur oxidation DsrE/DsrF family protein
MTIATLHLQAQTSVNREELFKKMESKMIFPFIKGSPLCGVIPIDQITNKPNPNKEVKLIFDFTKASTPGKQAESINAGLEEIARVMNLHVAAGVPKEKLKTIIVFHSGAIFSAMNDSYYLDNYKASNPNADILSQLKSAKTEMIICGQSLALREIAQSNLFDYIQVAFSAKTTLTKYIQEGYVLNVIN